MDRRVVVAVTLGLFMATAGAAPGTGAGAREGSVTIADAWARATAPGQANGAAYMVIRNAGAEPDRVLAASAAIARTVELHAHTIDAQGVARMTRVPAIEVPAQGAATLQPGGLHIMLIGLHEPLATGRAFPLELRLERAGTLTVEVAVRATGVGPMQHGSAPTGATPHGAHGQN